VLAGETPGVLELVTRHRGDNNEIRQIEVSGLRAYQPAVEDGGTIDAKTVAQNDSFACHGVALVVSASTPYAF
jgi:hypothetical protein